MKTQGEIEWLTLHAPEHQRWETVDIAAMNEAKKRSLYLSIKQRVELGYRTYIKSEASQYRIIGVDADESGCKFTFRVDLADSEMQGASMIIEATYQFPPPTVKDYLTVQ